MKAYLYILLTLLAFTIIMLFFGTARSQDIVQCSSFDSLINVVKSGNPASYDKTSWIQEFSLVEKSNISVYPENNQDALYNVEIKINSIKEEEYSPSFDEFSMLGNIVTGCTDFGAKYKNFENTSCRFTAKNLEDIIEAAKYGISFRLDNNYSIEGSLVNVYKKLCVKQHTPVPVKRPAVYLYPVRPDNVSVKVEVNGTITQSDPSYGNGWTVYAEPNGIIDGKYDYLFYEADLNKIELPEEGWVVEYGKLKSWFGENLPLLGLNKKETEQFEEYWLGKLKKAEYYEIKLLDNKFLSDNMRLVISPEPETMIRLNFYFMPLNYKKEIKEPVFVKTERKGFTVVEWGGIDAGDVRLLP